MPKFFLPVTILLIIIAGYWFGIRPYLITKQCHLEAIDFGLTQGSTGTKGTEEGRQSAIERKELYDLAYEQCLHSNGL